MNTEKLTRQAIRLAQRESRKRGRALTKEEVLKLRVQTVDPWVRVLLALTGVALAGVGIWSMAPEASSPGIALLIFGFLTMGASIVGWRKTIEAAFNGVDPLSFFDGSC
jgi:hypothetical protein